MTTTARARFTASRQDRARAWIRYRCHQAGAVALDAVAAILLFGFCCLLLPVLLCIF